ncbi:hypothetical protein [Salana multivorans]
MSTLTHSEAVTFYAARVRASLHGLAPEVVDDLTDGLEADLTEAILDELELAESGDVAVALASLEPEALEARFGAADAYAAELASAAGVVIVDDDEAAVPPKRPTLHQRLAARRERARVGVEGYVAEHPWARTTLAFLVTLRPVWWVARGFGWYIVLGSMLVLEPLQRRPGLLGSVLLVVMIVASVQWGRGAFLKGRWGRGLLRLLSAVAIVALVVGWATFGSGRALSAWNAGFEEGWRQRGNEVQQVFQDAVMVGGQEATNLFVFDAAGNPVENAQIVDQDGQPVVIGPPAPYGATWRQWFDSEPGWAEFPVPSGVFAGQQLNVFPYSYVPTEDIEFGEMGLPFVRPGALASAPRWPAATLLPVPGDESSEAESPEDVAEPGANGTVTGEEPDAGAEDESATGAGADPTAGADAGSDGAGADGPVATAAPSAPAEPGSEG